MIIALVSPKGGVGKTTLAVSLAWELQARGSRVLLVDGDPQQSASDASAAANERGLSPPATVAMGADLHKPKQVPRFARDFDHIIIDTPGVLDRSPKAALLVSDVALLPCSQSGMELWGNESLLEVIEQARMFNERLVAAFVITRKMPTTAIAKQIRPALVQTGLPVLKAETTTRVAWQEAMMAGQGVATYAPKDRAATELRKVLDEVLSFGAQLKEAANG